MKTIYIVDGASITMESVEEMICNLGESDEVQYCLGNDRKVKFNNKGIVNMEDLSFAHKKDTFDSVMHICTLLGYLICRDNDKIDHKYCVVSGNDDLSGLVHSWKSRGYIVEFMDKLGG